MKRFFTFSIILLLLLGSLVQAEVVNRIAAVVNNDIITVYQVDRELEKRQFGDGGLNQLSPQVLDEVRQRALASLIEETLVQQRVKELGIAVTDQEIEAAVGDVLLQNQLTRDELIEALELQGMDFEVYRDNLRKQILRYKLLGREVKSKVDVSSQEILDYFRAHIDDYRQKPTMHIARISFPIPANASPSQIDGVRSMANEALAKVQSGEEFFSVLLEYSTTQRAEGGDMGTFGVGELTPAFDRALDGLAEGEISGLVETPDGFHLLKLIDRQEGSVRQFDAVKGEITKTLTEQKTDEAFKSWAEGLRESAYIDVRL
jgi:peptidyl-prolyl cis-trans isomerase SurA